MTPTKTILKGWLISALAITTAILLMADSPNTCVFIATKAIALAIIVITISRIKHHDTQQA